MTNVLGQWWAPMTAVMFTACAFHAPSTTPPTTAVTSGPTSGMLRANNALTLDAGVSDIRVVVARTGRRFSEG
jgi:hypothetical protein